MGGCSNEYYERHVKPAPAGKAYTHEAEEAMNVTRVDPTLLVCQRTLRTSSSCPIGINFDVTGSLGDLPKTFWTKAALFAGQLMKCHYAPDDVAVSMSATGDITHDKAPLQAVDFCPPRGMDHGMQRLWIEGGGGSQHFESYEMMLYFYARHCEMPKARQPILIITADEGFREALMPRDLKKHFGDDVAESLSADQVFQEAREKFHDNVFLIHRYYGFDNGAKDQEIVAQWERVLGKDHIVLLPYDKAIVDIMLGLIAIRNGARTLDEYLRDMKTERDEPQSDHRVSVVARALERVGAMGPLLSNRPEPVQEAPKKPKKPWHA